jgi:hypothetical protein
VQRGSGTDCVLNISLLRTESKALCNMLGTVRVCIRLIVTFMPVQRVRYRLSSLHKDAKKWNAIPQFRSQAMDLLRTSVQDLILINFQNMLALIMRVIRLIAVSAHLLQKVCLCSGSVPTVLTSTRTMNAPGSSQAGLTSLPEYSRPPWLPHG